MDRITPAIRIRALAGYLLALCMAGAAYAGTDPDPLFASDEIIDVRIAAPFRSIMRVRSNEEYSPATFQFVDSDGNTVLFDAGIRARGHFRRRSDICEFTPLRLNFRKSQTKDTLFDHQDKLKLVTHCKNKSPAL